MMYPKFKGMVLRTHEIILCHTRIRKQSNFSRVVYSKSPRVPLHESRTGTLYDAMQFANVCMKNNIKIITSPRSGESSDSHISHIAIATNSKMLKSGVLGGERIAKLNELLRIGEYDLIEGMADLSST